MHYNIRILQYPNGEYQLRYYSEPLFKRDELPDEDMQAVLALKRKLKKEKDLKQNFDIEPFNNTLVRVVQDPEWEEYCINADKDNYMRFYRNANRSKQAVYTYARCNKWDWFVTWTLDSNKNRYNYDECSAAVRTWLHNQKARYAPDLTYLIVPEHHKDGAWHFHGLLSNCGDMVFSSSGMKDKKGNLIYNLQSYTLGFTTATRVKDTNRVAKYIGKYITKDLSAFLFGRQSYFVSKNLEKPKQYTGFVNIAEEDIYSYVQKLADSLGLEVKHVSSVGSKETSYTVTKYFELN